MVGSAGTQKAFFLNFPSRQTLWPAFAFHHRFRQQRLVHRRSGVHLADLFEIGIQADNQEAASGQSCSDAGPQLSQVAY
jgi:hypothetical protein